MFLQRSLVVASVAVFSLALVDAQAAPGNRRGGATSRPARDPAAMFEKADADADGKVTKAEFAAFAKRAAGRRAGRGKGEGKRGGEALFDRLDADRDGALTAEEFAKIGQRRKARDDAKANA